MARIRVLQQAQALYLRQNAVVGLQRYSSSDSFTNFLTNFFVQEMNVVTYLH